MHLLHNNETWCIFAYSGYLMFAIILVLSCCVWLLYMCMCFNKPFLNLKFEKKEERNKYRSVWRNWLSFSFVYTNNISALHPMCALPCCTTKFVINVGELLWGWGVGGGTIMFGRRCVHNGRCFGVWPMISDPMILVSFPGNAIPAQTGRTISDISL